MPHADYRMPGVGGLGHLDSFSGAPTFWKWEEGVFHVSLWLLGLCNVLKGLEDYAQLWVISGSLSSNCEASCCAFPTSPNLHTHKHTIFCHSGSLCTVVAIVVDSGRGTGGYPAARAYASARRGTTGYDRPHCPPGPRLAPSRGD